MPGKFAADQLWDRERFCGAARKVLVMGSPRGGKGRGGSSV